MRLNMPVSGRRYAVAPEATLVSTTDLKGRITHCNPAFIEVSGYEKGELLGQPHNLIRHPDMPSEAFRDLWATIQSGRPWSALVKNRRKNGDYYWVLANVTPLMDGERPVGYMSVRTCPTEAQVEAAEALYRRMREDAARGVTTCRLEAGTVLGRGPLAMLRHQLAGSLNARLAATSLIASLAAYAIGLAAAPQWPGTTSLVLGALGAAAAGVTAALVLRRWTVAPMRRLLGMAYRMAAGDLTQRIDGDRHGLAGHLTGALHQLNVNLRALVRDASEEVQRIEGSAAEIAGGSLDLSARTESQASSVQQTAASMEEVTSTLRQSADAARQAYEAATEAKGMAENSSAAVSDVNRTMSDIARSSARIGEIIQVIDTISFQTNILALNAAVEAARAGTQGRGFAVVASEVRSLAQRTTEAAKEIRGLIAESADRVHCGEQQVSQAQAAMERALGSVQRVNALVSQISGGAREQLTGVSQVNEAVTQIDGITQRNAAMVEELSAAASSLKSQAEVVSASVKVFRV
jgi:aerotaxis receptor